MFLNYTILLSTEWTKQKQVSCMSIEIYRYLRTAYGEFGTTSLFSFFSQRRQS